MTRTASSEGDREDSTTGSVHDLDEIDRQILGSLTTDARNTSSPEIADRVDVTPATVRNRIEKLESNGVVDGYETRIDYQRLGFLEVLFVCTIQPDAYGSISQEVGQLPAVTQTRIVHSGSHNFHVVAIASCQNHIATILDDLVEFDIAVESISLIGSEEAHQLSEFGAPEESTHDQT